MFSGALAFAEGEQVVSCSLSEHNSGLGLVVASGGSAISWSLKPLLSGVLELMSRAGSPCSGLLLSDGLAGSWGNSMSAQGRFLDAAPFFFCNSAGAFAGCPVLMEFVAFLAKIFVAEVPLELSLRGVLRFAEPSWGMARFVLQLLA
ncbi:unnamed protein product [Sphagnum jensenii]|uniref:Uncharacterized protein n=1 Tax=Sphagnum jensenii TaxID=128206 RepID=A0ABP1AMU5_9BRYO